MRRSTAKRQAEATNMTGAAVNFTAVILFVLNQSCQAFFSADSISSRVYIPDRPRQF